MRAISILLITLFFVSSASAAGNCDEVYNIAISKAGVQTLDALRIRTREYLNSANFKSSEDNKNFQSGGNYGMISGYLNGSWNTKSASQSQYQKATAGDLDKLQTLYYVDKQYGLGILQKYNDCIQGNDPVIAEVIYNPGDKKGTIRVRMRADGTWATIKSVHSSGITVDKGSLAEGSTIDSGGGSSADFEVDPGAKVGWILVSTSAGGETVYFPLVPSPPPPKTEHVTRRFTIPSKTEKWLPSGTTLSDREQVEITVDPQQSNWVIQGNKKESDYQGLGRRADTNYVVAGAPVGALIVKVGKRIVGFDKGYPKIAIQGPGEISFLCNDNKAGFKDNKGEVVALIDVFPLEKTSQ